MHRTFVYVNQHAMSHHGLCRDETLRDWAPAGAGTVWPGRGRYPGAGAGVARAMGAGVAAGGAPDLAGQRAMAKRNRLHSATASGQHQER